MARDTPLRACYSSSPPACLTPFSRTQAGLESGRGFRAAMKTLDPFDNLPSLLLMPQLFVDLNEQEVEYARNIARCTQQKEGVQILHNVVKYLQNLLDSGLYMCRLTPEWQAVHALLRHESSGGIAADGARPTEDPEDKVCTKPPLRDPRTVARVLTHLPSQDKLEASWRPTHSAPFNAVWQKARQYVASLPPAERSPSFWDPMKPEKQKEIIEQAKKASKFSAAGAIARATDPDPNDMQSDSEEEVVSDAEEVVSDREEEPEDHKGAESAVERSFRTYIRKGCFREQQEQSPSWALLCTVRSIVTHIQRNFKPPLQDPMAGTRGPACSTFPPPREATDAKGVRAHFSRRAELLQSTVTCLRDNSVPDATVVDFRETLSLVAQHVSTQEAQRKGIEGILRRLEAKPKQSPFEAHGAGKKAKKEAPERTLVLDHFSRLLLDLQKELSALDAAVQEWGTAQVEQHDRLKMVRMDELNRGGKTALDTLKILTSAFSKVVVDDDDDPPDLSSGSSSEADSEEVDMDYKDRAPVKKRGDLSSETSSSGDELSRSDSEDPDAVHAAGERMALFGRDDVDDRKRADERYQRYTSTEVLRRLLHLVPRPVQHPAPGEARPAGGALDAYQQGGYPFAMEEPNADTDGFDGVKGTAERIIVLHACHEGLRGLKKSLRGRGGGTKEQKGEALSAITQALALVEAAGMGVGSNQEVGPPEPPMPVQAPKGKKRGYLLHQLMSASKSVSKEIRALEQQGVVASMRKLRTRYEVFGALHTSKAGLLDASDGFKARYREVQALSRRLQVATHTRPSGVWSGRGGLDRLRGQRLCQPRAWKALSVFLFYMCAARDLHEQSVARVHVRDVLREVESRCRQLLLYFDNKESWDTKAALDCAEAILRYDPLHMPMPDDATLSEALTRIDPGMEVAVREKVQEARKALNSLAPAVFPIVSEAALAHSLQKDPSKPSWFGGSPKDWIDGLDGIYEAQMGMPYEDQKTAFLRSAREGWDRERQGRSDDVWGGATKSWWRGWMLCYQARRLTWEACRRATPDTLRLQRRIDAVQAWRCNLDCGAALQRLESLSKQQGSALEARVRDLREPATAGADPSQAPSGAPADPVSDDDEANPDSRADPVAKAEQERKTGLKEAQKSQAALKKAVDEVRQALVEFQGVLATGGLQQRLSEAPPAGRKRFLHLQERAEDEIHCSLHNLQHGLYSLVRSQGKCALKFVEGLLNSLLATQEQKVSEEEQAMLDDAAPAPEIASTGPTEQLEKEDSFFQHGMIADMVEAVEGSEVDLQLVVEIAQRDEKDAAGGSGGATLEKALHTRALYRHFISEDFQNDFFLGALDDRGLDRAQLHDALVDHPSLVRAWFVQVLCVSHNARPRAWTGLAQHPVFHSIVREEGATAAGPAVLGGQEQPNLLPSCSLFECVWAQYTLALRDSLLLRAWSHYRDHRLQAEADVVPGDTSRNDDEAGEDSDAEDVDADPDQGSTLHMEQSQALVRFCLSVLTCGRAMAPALLDHQKLEIDPSAGMCRTDSRTPERQQTRFEEAIFQSFQECYDGRLKPWVIKTKQAFLQKNAKGEKFIAAAMEAFFLRLDERSTGPSQTFVVQNLTAAQRQERLRRIEEGLEVDRLSEIPVLETRPDIPLRFPWVLNGQQINELFQQYIFQEQPMEGVLEGSVADDRYEMNQVHAWLYEDLPEMDDSGPENPAEAVDRYVTISESCRSDPLLETRGHGYSLLQLSELRVCPFFSAVGTVRSVRNEFGSDHSRAAASWLFRHFVPPFGSGYGLLKSPDGLSLYRTLVHVSSVDVARALFGARLEEGALQPVLQALALKPKWSDLVTQDVQKMLSKVLEFYRQRVQLQRDFLLVPGRVLGFVRRVIDYSDQISVLQAGAPPPPPARPPASLVHPAGH